MRQRQLTQNQETVINKEIADRERCEACIAIAEDNHGHPGCTDVCLVGKISFRSINDIYAQTYRVWLEPTLVGQSISVQALCLASAVEEDVGNGHDPVVDDSSGRDQIDEPTQNDV